MFFGGFQYKISWGFPSKIISDLRIFERVFTTRIFHVKASKKEFYQRSSNNRMIVWKSWVTKSSQFGFNWVKALKKGIFVKGVAVTRGSIESLGWLDLNHTVCELYFFFFPLVINIFTKANFTISIPFGVGGRHTQTQDNWELPKQIGCLYFSLYLSHSTFNLLLINAFGTHTNCLTNLV